MHWQCTGRGDQMIEYNLENRICTTARLFDLFWITYHRNTSSRRTCIVHFRDASSHKSNVIVSSFSLHLQGRLFKVPMLTNIWVEDSFDHTGTIYLASWQINDIIAHLPIHSRKHIYSISLAFHYLHRVPDRSFLPHQKTPYPTTKQNFSMAQPFTLNTCSKTSSDTLHRNGRLLPLRRSGQLNMAGFMLTKLIRYLPRKRNENSYSGGHAFPQNFINTLFLQRTCFNWVRNQFMFWLMINSLILFHLWHHTYQLKISVKIPQANLSN